MRTVVAIGVAGSFGAVARYGVEGFVSERTNGSFPFSTLSLETFRMIEDGAYLAAGFNAFGSLALGLVAVWVGIVAGRMI